MLFAVRCIESLGIQIIEQTKTHIKFLHLGHPVLLYPYSGWHTGKTITDGRGIDKLLKQLKK